MCCTLSSVSEKPRPARTRRLDLMVGQRTMGFSLSTGRGATAAAFVMRALRRRDFRPGYTLFVSLALGFQACRTGYVFGVRRCSGCRTWSKWVRTRRCQSLRKSADDQCHAHSSAKARRELTVVLYLLVVLDRLSQSQVSHRISNSDVEAGPILNSSLPHIRASTHHCDGCRSGR